MAARFGGFGGKAKPKSKTSLQGDRTFATIKDTIRRKNKEKDAEKIVTEW